MDDRLENEVKILCHLGTLERVRQPSSQSYQTRNMVAPPPVQAQQETSHPVEPLNTEAALTRRVNRYKRRDLKAEE